MNWILGMSWLSGSYALRTDRGVRMIEIDEATGNWTSYIRGVSLNRWELTEMHWTNGTQYVCGGAIGKSPLNYL